MNSHTRTWALVLAAGEGSRLKSLTTDASGVAIPKQFCSLDGGESLLREALHRAAHVALPERRCVVVAEQHRPWWRAALADIAPPNIVVQPRNRGTAHGILLPLLHILARDPDAVVVLLPADHHIQDEIAFAEPLRRAARLAAECRDELFLLGVEPDSPDTELGYILPVREGSMRASAVAHFIEKPPLRQAQALLERGALWNVFIIAATARALLQLFLARDAALVERFAAARDRTGALEDLYDELAAADFSRDVLEGQEARLRVVPVPACGWSDLGTPQRVAATLHRLERRPNAGTGMGRGAALSLALQYARGAFGASTLQVAS
jgi:mannose-1-phosphate guanylyltransferase